MRAWMLGIVLAFVICIQIALAIEPLSAFESDNRAMKQVFKDACELSKYDCDGIEQPVVRRSTQLESMQIYGLYVGGKTLWIDSELMPLRARLTMFHETIHYLQVNVGRLDPELWSTAAGCVVEREAMELSNTYARIKKMPKAYQRSVEEWKQTYRC